MTKYTPKGKKKGGTSPTKKPFQLGRSGAEFQPSTFGESHPSGKEGWAVKLPAPSKKG